MHILNLIVEHMKSLHWLNAYDVVLVCTTV